MTSNDGSGFGKRLKHARQLKKLSGLWVTNYLNGYLLPLGLRPIALKTYYSWEKIGTPLEVSAGHSYPHPIIYRALTYPLETTTSYLLTGKKSEVEFGSSHPNKPYQAELIEKAAKKIRNMSDMQQRALLAALEAME
jgi:hypothetical protein